MGKSSLKSIREVNAMFYTMGDRVKPETSRRFKIIALGWPV